MKQQQKNQSIHATLEESLKESEAINEITNDEELLDASNEPVEAIEAIVEQANAHEGALEKKSEAAL